MDNERPIEKLLRDYAKKRRADAGEPLEMHPATRRLLQGEVTRQFPKTQRGGFSLSGFFARWKPGVIYALCALAIVAVSVPLLLPTFRKAGPEAELARAVPGETAMDKKLSAATVEPSAARETDEAQPVGEARRADEKAQATLAFADAERAKVSLKLEKENLPAPPARTLAPDTSSRSAPASSPPAPQITSRSQPQPATSLPVQTRPTTREITRAVTEAPTAVAGGKAEAGRDAQAVVASDSAGSPAGAQLAARSPSPVPTSAARAPATPAPTGTAAFSERYGLAKNAAATLVQKFSQTAATGDSRRSTDPAPTATPILTTFQLEQSGDQLRVIDSDGSTYTGAITPPATSAYYATSVEPKRATTPAAGSKPVARGVSVPLDSAAGSAQNYSFRVTGTNRTLQQPVVFSGSILLLTNAVATGQTALIQAPVARSQNQFAPTQNQLPSLLNSSISGRVQLGTNRELQINAVPVNP